jgi:hypothetical protein
MFEPNFSISALRKDVHTIYSENELQAFIKANPKKQIKVLGSDHSWSGCTHSDDELYVRLLGFNQIQLFDEREQSREKEPNKKTFVRVGASVTIKDLLEYLHTFGKTILNLGTIREQRVIGAIMTGTHGSGLNSLMSSHVIQMEIMRIKENNDVQKEIVSNDDIRFQNLVLSLGSYAIVLNLDLVVCEQFNLHEEKKLITYEEFKQRDMEEDFLHYDMYYLNPYTTDLIHVKRRVAQEEVSWDAEFKSFLANNLYNGFLTMINELNSSCFSYNAMSLIDEVFSERSIVGPSHDILSNLAPRVPTIDIEFYIKEDQLHEVIDFIFFYFASVAPDHLKKYIKKGHIINSSSYEKIINNLNLRTMFDYLQRVKFDTNLYLSIRMVECALSKTISPTYDSRAYALDFEYQTIYQVNPCIVTFYKVFYDVLVNYFGARTHWAKKHFLKRDQIQRLYGANATNFIADLDLFDPSHTLRGGFIERTFIDPSEFLFDIEYYHLSVDQLKNLYTKAPFVNNISHLMGFHKMLFLKGSASHSNIINSYGRIFEKDHMIPFIEYKNRFNTHSGQLVKYIDCSLKDTSNLKIKYLFKDKTYSEEYKQVDQYNIMCKIKVRHNKYFVLLSRF